MNAFNREIQKLNPVVEVGRKNPSACISCSRILHPLQSGRFHLLHRPRRSAAGNRVPVNLICNVLNSIGSILGSEWDRWDNVDRLLGRVVSGWTC